MSAHMLNTTSSRFSYLFPSFCSSVLGPGHAFALWLRPCRCNYTTSSIRAGNSRQPQLGRGQVMPHACGPGNGRRFRKMWGPSRMALSNLDTFFDLRPSHLLETEDFLGLDRARVMAVDFVENSQGFQIKADIPGVAKEDIKLDVDHNVITISAKRSSQASTKSTDDSTKGAHSSSTGDDTSTQAVDDGSTADVSSEESEEKIMQNDSSVLRYERFDSFQSRSFRVPQTADLKTVSAKYVDGVLTVDIKKREDVLDVRRTVDIA